LGADFIPHTLLEYRSFLIQIYGGDPQSMMDS
jgi:hypothetical protein